MNLTPDSYKITFPKAAHYVQPVIEALVKGQIEKAQGHLLSLDSLLWAAYVGPSKDRQEQWYACKWLTMDVQDLIKAKKYPDALAKRWDLKARLEA